MKKLLLMSAALVATTGVFAKKVKFQVDMTGQTVSQNGVHVAGSFQNWSPSGTALTQEGSSNLYSTVVDINAGQVIEFKFINNNDWSSGVEDVPVISRVESAANGGSNGNRWSYIDSSANDTTLLSFKFSGSAPTGKYAVRFAVDMQKETRLDPNGIHLAGSVQSWNPATTRLTNLFPSNNKVYEVILILDAGNYEFKYVNGNIWSDSTDERAIPSACTTNNNRTLSVTTSDVTLDKVCFNACTACPSAPIPTYKLAFVVDMNSSDCDGGFDSVTVAGAGAKLTNFGTGLKMTQIGTTGIYGIVVNDLDSGEVKFKFRSHKNGNTNWEGGSDRTFALSANDTIDLTCFGSRVVGPCPSKPASSSITFIVDLIDETPAAKIYVMGTFATPNWQAGAREMAPVSGVPGLYSLTVDSICPGTFNFKFVNGDPNAGGAEELFSDSTQRSCVEPSGVGGWNRVYTRTVATPVVLNYKFSTCTAGRNPVGIKEVSLNSNLRMYPNPTSTYANLEFNDNSNTHNVQIMDIAGRVIRSYDNCKQTSLRIEKNELSKGLYFVNVTNDKNQSGSIRLMID